MRCDEDEEINGQLPNQLRGQVRSYGFQREDHIGFQFYGLFQYKVQGRGTPWVGCQSPAMTLSRISDWNMDSLHQELLDPDNSRLCHHGSADAKTQL